MVQLASPTGPWNYATFAPSRECHLFQESAIHRAARTGVRSSRTLALCSRRNVFIHQLFQKIQRNGTTLKYNIVKVSGIEFFAQRLFCFGPQTPQKAFSYFVGTGLAWPGNVPCYFRGGIMTSHGRVGEHVFHRLFLSPSFRVHSGVDNETT